MTGISLYSMTGSATPQQCVKSHLTDKHTCCIPLSRQCLPAGLPIFGADSPALLPNFLRLTCAITDAGPRLLPVMWLASCRIGFPPIKYPALRWAHREFGSPEACPKPVHGALVIPPPQPYPTPPVPFRPRTDAPTPFTSLISKLPIYLNLRKTPLGIKYFNLDFISYICYSFS